MSALCLKGLYDVKQRYDPLISMGRYVFTNKIDDSNDNNNEFKP